MIINSSIFQATLVPDQCWRHKTVQSPSPRYAQAFSLGDSHNNKEAKERVLSIYETTHIIMHHPGNSVGRCKNSRRT
jgi:hypothetical protein